MDVHKHSTQIERLEVVETGRRRRWTGALMSKWKQNSWMGQAYPTERCEQCGTLKVLVLPADGKGPRALRCLACDKLDPIKLPANVGWIEGELRPPR
jgi:hypothetical protein